MAQASPQAHRGVTGDGSQRRSALFFPSPIFRIIQGAPKQRHIVKRSFVSLLAARLEQHLESTHSEFSFSGIREVWLLALGHPFRKLVLWTKKFRTWHGGCWETCYIFAYCVSG